MYHFPTQLTGLVLVGINFALGLTLVDVLTGFPLLFGAPNKLSEALDAAEFAFALEFPLVCGNILHGNSERSVILN